MKDKVEIWITTDCAEVTKTALLNRGIAMGNEYRFDNVSWKIIVTRTADLFLEVLRRALEHRITAEYPDVQPIWRMAVGKDELLLVPFGQDRQKELLRIRELMAFLRGLLYDRKFVGLTLRAVLTEAINARWEEKLLAGSLDREANIAKLVADLNALDVAEAAAALEATIAAGRAAAPQAPRPPEAPAQAEPTEAPAEPTGAEATPEEPPAEAAIGEENPAETETQTPPTEPPPEQTQPDEQQPPSTAKRPRKRKKSE
jgi:hypothetical protein